MIRHIPYRDFRQACRAYPPSTFIPAIASIAARLGPPPYSDAVRMRTPPWGLAAAAKECIVHSNEFRSGELTEAKASQLLSLFAESGDLQPERDRTDSFVLEILTAIMHEQLPYQEPVFEELSRSHAWIVEGLADVDTRVIDQTALTDMLGGVSLRDTIGSTFFLQVGAYQNSGMFLHGWLDQPNFMPVVALYPKANIEHVASRLTINKEDFKSAVNQHSTGLRHLERADYNPLISTPFVQLPGNPPIAPVPQLILRTATPSGLYYAGMAKHGQHFANDLGLLFENYIGKQLRLITGAEVLGEITYGRKGGKRSVDWFVITPEIVILIEVKSKRLGPAARAGAPQLAVALRDSIYKAHGQIERTLAELDAGDPAFASIPTDRPILGLIVTAEPFYSAGTYMVGEGLNSVDAGRLGTVPVAPSYAREIEHLVTHGADLGPLLHDRVAKRGDGIVDLKAPPMGRNPILEAAWKTYPFPGNDGIVS